jgi:predicted nucleic acid-binding protein
VVTLAEIRRGVELMPAGRRRDRLASWLADELPARFEDRILRVDEPVAAAWGVAMARSQRLGGSIGAMDGFLAATAEAHRLTLATRNARDFATAGISLFDPWRPRP